MTDRISAFTVVLEKDIREDDAESIKTSLGMVKGVLKVEAHVMDDLSHFLAETRVRNELEKKLWAVLYPEKTKT